MNLQPQFFFLRWLVLVLVVVPLVFLSLVPTVVVVVRTATGTTTTILHSTSHVIVNAFTTTSIYKRPTKSSYSSLSRDIIRTRTTTSKTRRNLSFFDHWDDILYQTESWGNALASFGLQQQQQASAPPDIGGMILNTAHDTSSSNNNNMLLAFPVMYLAGLFTSFSPCVWGLLPLTISYISTAANERSDQRTLLPTLAFAAGLASVFCTMGMITVFTVGTVFGGGSSAAVTTDMNGNNAMAFSTAMILPLLSNLVCFIMGLKLLDLVDIALPSLTFLDPQKLFATTPSSMTATTNMPNGGGGGPILLDASGRQVSIRTTTTTISTEMIVTDEEQRQQETNKDNSALFRTFLLGGSSALVASPCATPVLTSILAYVANNMAMTEASSSSSSSVLLSTLTSTLIGGLLLFGYTLGYSTPLLIVAATSGQALVRLKQQQNQGGDEQSKPMSSLLSSIPNRIAPWVTPITGGILLYLGTTGLLVNLIGDPSLSGLIIIE